MSNKRQDCVAIIDSEHGTYGTILFRKGVVYQCETRRTPARLVRIYEGDEAVFDLNASDFKRCFQPFYKTKVLVVHNENQTLQAKVGAMFRVTEEDSHSYTITGEVYDEEHDKFRTEELYFTKEPDMSGCSYKTWFELKEVYTPVELKGDN